MHAMKKEIPKQILHDYSRLKEEFYKSKKWFEMSEQELWHELCLCILSSNVRYELARSAFSHLFARRYLEIEWIARTPISTELIALELRRPIYSPKKLDGSRRKYRFPNSRTRNIVQAAKLIASNEGWLSTLLRDSNSEKAAREILVKYISGIGMKQASHFLRNIGYSNRLAIIDSHILSFLKEFDMIEGRRVRTLTPNTYVEMESLFQQICDELRLDLSIFDNAVWHYMRRQ